MDVITLSRLQFAITTIYHFLFVPISLGLSIFIAIMQTMYLKTDNIVYKRLAKFIGKLFIISFAMGVVTGIVQEFHFVCHGCCNRYRAGISFRYELVGILTLYG